MSKKEVHKKSKEKLDKKDENDGATANKRPQPDLKDPFKSELGTFGLQSTDTSREKVLKDSVENGEDGRDYECDEVEQQEDGDGKDGEDVRGGAKEKDENNGEDDGEVGVKYGGGSKDGGSSKGGEMR